jgi:hypothetical protein
LTHIKRHQVLSSGGHREEQAIGKTKGGLNIQAQRRCPRRRLQRLVELSLYAAIVVVGAFFQLEAASSAQTTIMAVYEKHQLFIHQQHQPSSPEHRRGATWAKPSKWGPKPTLPPGIRATARDYSNPVDYQHTALETPREP